uniref:NADH-ubiquinone oxidoreductase chain 4L n=1 Tax=Cylisticus convexus TaxID=96835 RepID=A0A0G2T4L2_9CRUS|nr:NADH dehydrogenase subunit 4L [Cylisticus convexus]
MFMTNHTQMIFLFFMFSSAFLSFLLISKHLLSSLVCIEYMALIIFFLISITIFLTSNEMFNSFFFISIAVCEAALGLSITVLYARKKGDDLFKFY